jgi:integrase
MSQENVEIVKANYEAFASRGLDGWMEHFADDVEYRAPEGSLDDVLESVRDDRLFAAWRLLANSGVRRGELLGLRWSDLDLEAGRMSVVRSLVSVRNKLSISEPKTRRGRRSIQLDPATVAELRAHRRR